MWCCTCATAVTCGRSTCWRVPRAPWPATPPPPPPTRPRAPPPTCPGTGDPPAPAEGAAAERPGHPLPRRHGLGRALVENAMAVADESTDDPPGRLRLWAHGDHPSASALALRLGFDRWRVLWQMRRSLFA